VAILDADKEGFLRSTTALIQTFGRAARHINGEVILYADRMTDSMKRAIDETNRRRAKQEAYNEEHHISPVGITKAVYDITSRLANVAPEEKDKPRNARELAAKMQQRELENLLTELEKQMKAAAAELEFERAAMLRDQIFELRAIIIEESDMPPWKKQKALAGMMP
jgi:excinuclease ABC subunit B